jgi:hypothetical protein
MAEFEIYEEEHWERVSRQHPLGLRVAAKGKQVTDADDN